MWRQGSVACNCLRSGLPFSEQNNTKLPTAKKATAFFWLPHGEWLGGQANFACGCGWNPRFKKGGSTFCWPPFLVWVKRILIHFFKHKNRPILEWCVSALVRIFHDKRFEKFTKFLPAPLTAGQVSGFLYFFDFSLWNPVISWYYYCIAKVQKNTKRKTRSAVPKIGVPGTLRVVFNFFSCWINYSRKRPLTQIEK